MNLTFKALSALLSYPTAELQQSAGELRDVLRTEAIMPFAAGDPLDHLIEEIADRDLLDLQERYVELFDRTRSLSLHLFEHVHGESRDRGQAMIDLQNLYETHGLSIATTELPDFLPLFLEYLSTRPVAEARELIGQTAHIIAALGERLGKRGSLYSAIFVALVNDATVRPARSEVEAVLAAPDIDPNDFAALDAAWEDAPVTFGPEAAGNCKDDLTARIRAARRPAAELK